MIFDTLYIIILGDFNAVSEATQDRSRHTKSAIVPSNFQAFCINII